MADDSRQFREQTHGLIRETITKIAQVVVQSRITFGREVKTTENYWVIFLQHGIAVFIFKTKFKRIPAI